MPTVITRAAITSAAEGRRPARCTPLKPTRSRSPTAARGHAVEGGLQPRHAGDPLVDRGQADDDEERPDDEPDQADQGAGDAAHALPDVDDEIGDVDAGHYLAQREAAQKFVFAHPAAPDDNLLIDPSAEAAAEAEKPDLEAHQEQSQERYGRMMRGSPIA
jgi:hypothetical protein